MKLGKHIINNKNRYKNCKIFSRVITNIRYKLCNRCYWNKRIDVSNNQSIEYNTNIEEYYSR